MKLPLALLAALALAACASDADPGAPDAVGSRYTYDGDVATPTSTVIVDYRGTLMDGTVFDEGKGARFSLEEVVVGFQENIAGMEEGETKGFDVPPEKGYGDNPPPVIPRGETITFEVTLHEVVE